MLGQQMTMNVDRCATNPLDPACSGVQQTPPQNTWVSQGWYNPTPTTTTPGATPGQVVTTTTGPIVAPSPLPYATTPWYSRLWYDIPVWGRVLGIAALAFGGYKLYTSRKK